MKTVRLAIEDFMGSDEIASSARSTRRGYSVVLGRLAEEIGEKTPIAQLSRSHVDGTLSQVRGIVTEATMNSYRAALRKFGTWIVVNGYSKTNPTLHLKNGKAVNDVRKRKPIVRDQATRLIEVAYATHPRDGITALILLSTGLRDSEVVGLRWRDVDFANRVFVAYRPKVKDWHRAPWSDQLAEAMEKWRALYEERHGAVQPDWHVVPALGYRSASGIQRMNPDWPMEPTRMQTELGRRVKRWLRAVGETDLRGRASHTLRRTAATLAYEAGGVDVAQSLLGHESPAMTMKYIGLDVRAEKLRDVMRGFSI